MDQLSKKNNSSFDNRPVPLFDPMLQLENVSENWLDWTKKFEIFAEHTDLIEKGNKIMIAALLFYAGPEVSRIYDTINEQSEHDEYDDVKNVLAEYFNISEKKLDQPINELADKIDTVDKEETIQSQQPAETLDINKAQKENSTVTSSQTNNDRVSSNRGSGKYSRKALNEAKEVIKKHRIKINTSKMLI